MLRSCPRCGRVHEPGKCRVSIKRKQAERTPARKFRSTALWQACAERVRDRDMGLCAACLHGDPVIYEHRNLSVHHVAPIEEDFDSRLDEDNCITLCHRHHMLAEAGMIAREQLHAWIAEANERMARLAS